MSIDAMKQALSAIEFADMHIKEIVTGSTNRIVAENLLRESAKTLRAAIEQAPWVKSYAGGKPNYTTPEEQPGVKLDASVPLVVQPHPAFKKWQGLTDEDRDEILRWVEWKEVGSQPVAPQKLIAYVERKLREKNT